MQKSKSIKTGFFACLTSFYENWSFYVIYYSNYRFQFLFSRTLTVAAFLFVAFLFLCLMICLGSFCRPYLAHNRQSPKSLLFLRIFIFKPGFLDGWTYSSYGWIQFCGQLMIGQGFYSNTLNKTSFLCLESWVSFGAHSIFRHFTNLPQLVLSAGPCGVSSAYAFWMPLHSEATYK